MITITLPNDYGYVLLAASSTFVISFWLGGRVGPFRKTAKVPYPYEYASYEQIQSAAPNQAKAMEKFNCAQRGHQNFNENHVSALGSMLIAGLKYPRAAAVLGAVWSVNRIAYAIGYTASEKPAGAGRYYGGAWMLAHLALIGYAVKTSWDLAMA